MENNGDAANSTPESGAGRLQDGLIDYSRYSDEQLRDLTYLLDRNAFPINFENLQTEIRRRATDAALGSDASTAAPVTFTERDGWRGWLRAKRNRQPLYGSGSVAVTGDGLELRGWRRTWLGAPVAGSLSIGLDSIRNVATAGSRVRLEARRRGWFARRIEFRMASAGDARNLAASLPTTQSTGFAKRWSEQQAFESALRQTGRAALATPVLVAINVVVFLLMYVGTSQYRSLTSQALVGWGANLGAQTLHGQWWRLFSSMFLHVGLPHIFFNMWALWHVGRFTERLYGSARALTLYFLCGALACVASLAWNPEHLSVGASGAIFGLCGVLLAYLARGRTRVPRSVFRAHWFSLLVFVLYSVASGFAEPTIDNAAHIGGLLSGLILGWLTAVPLGVPMRRSRQVAHASATGIATTALLLAGLWLAGGINQRAATSERYWRAHQQYFNRQEANLVRWQEIVGQYAAGSANALDTAMRFENDVLPFWETAKAFVNLDLDRLPEDERGYAIAITQYIEARLTLARLIARIADADSATVQKEIPDKNKEVTRAQARIERLQLRAVAAVPQRALSHRHWVEHLLTYGFHRTPECVRPPAVIQASPSRTDSKNDGPGRYTATACAAQRAFLTRDFAALEALIAHPEEHLDDAELGTATYFPAFGGLGDLFSYGRLQGIDVPMRTIAEWRRAYPQSTGPDLVEGNLFECWAYGARGAGTANTVTSQMWEAYAYRLYFAAASLEDISTAGETAPYYYSLSMRIHFDQNNDAEEVRRIFDEGHRRYANQTALYRPVLRSLMPRWGGSYERELAFINEQASEAGAERDMRYASLVLDYADLEGEQSDVFKDTGVDWQRMKAGLEQLIRKHPTSDLVLNEYANFACRAGDWSEFDRLRRTAASRFSSTAWSSPYSFQTCDAKASKAAAGT